MKLQEFIKKGLVRKSTKDLSLSKSLILTANIDLRFLKNLEINDDSARKIMTNYYDVLRSLLEAISCLEGYKIYSHEAFFFLLKEKGENQIAQKFDRFRKIRNSINYYGKNISIEEVKENKEEIIKIIDTLKIKFLKEIK